MSCTVVGLVDDRLGGLVGASTGLAPRDRIDRWARFSSPDETPSARAVLVTVDKGVSAADLRPAVRRALDSSNPVADEITVRTLDEQAEWTIASVTDDAQTLTIIGLAFAAVALVVAALVIANTFQVLVAQRTRLLALLRCVGADRSQLRQSVMIEALLLGVVASAAGLVGGIGLVQGALVVLRRTWPGVPLPATASLTVWTVAIPLLLGVAVTVVASLSPAHAATRVSPLAAMRPADAPHLSDRGGRTRASWAAALVLGGGALLAAGVALATRLPLKETLVLGLLGGAVSFVGVLLSAVFWAPRLVAAVARPLARRPAIRLAGANSARNGRRTAATSAALLIGVTLVVMMATGAATARSALKHRLDAEYPYDVSVSSRPDAETPSPLPESLVRQLEETNGVADSLLLTSAYVDIAAPDGRGWTYSGALGMTPADGERVLRSPDQVAGLTDGTVVIGQDVADASGLTEGDDVRVRASTVIDDAGDEVPGRGTPVDLRVHVTSLPGYDVLLTPATLAKVSTDAAPAVLWLRLGDGAETGDTVALLDTAASGSGTPVYLEGTATRRAAYQGVIDTMLSLVVGLLAVSVVIALVGVANTLSLSVIERRRESATLRAVGLTRGQLRASLAAEGMLIAGVGAVVGAVIGTGYGWVGARTLLASVGPTPVTVAWREIGLVVLIALVAGFVASVVPARSAVRTSPVEALAVE